MITKVFDKTGRKSESVGRQIVNTLLVYDKPGFYFSAIHQDTDAVNQFSVGRSLQHNYPLRLASKINNHYLCTYMWWPKIYIKKKTLYKSHRN